MQYILNFSNVIHLLVSKPIKTILFHIWTGFISRKVRAPVQRAHFEILILCARCSEGRNPYSKDDMSWIGIRRSNYVRSQPLVKMMHRPVSSPCRLRQPTDYHRSGNDVCLWEYYGNTMGNPWEYFWNPRWLLPAASWLAPGVPS